jgi:hypothetical protein
MDEALVRKARSRAEWLLQRAEEGLFTVPEELEQASRAIGVVHAAHDSAQISAREAHDDLERNRGSLVQRVTDAACAGKELPNAQSLTKAVQAAEQAALEVDVLANAQDAVVQRFYHIVGEQAVPFVVNHLRPGLDELLASARDHAAVLGYVTDQGQGAIHRVTSEREAFCDPDERKRRAWIALERLY